MKLFDLHPVSSGTNHSQAEAVFGELSDVSMRTPAGMPVSQSPPGPHHRSTERLPFISFAWYKSLEDKADPADEGVARSCDISEKGAGMVTTRALAVGVRVFLEVVSRVGNVSAIGRVAHCTAMGDGCFRVGIRIEWVPPTDQLTLQRIVVPSGYFRIDDEG